MSRVISALESGKPFTLTAAADDICKACPYNTEGVCKDIEKVSRYDKAVKALFELEYGREYKYGDTAEKVKARVYSQNKLKEICGDCEWAEICTGKN